MRSSRPARKYKHVARGKFRVFRLGWLVLTVSSMTILIAGTYEILATTTLQSEHRYIGSVRPGRNPISVKLPAGAVLDQILVSYGETVFKGQTVATLDVSTLNVTRQQVVQLIAVQSQYLGCLTDWENRNEPAVEFSNLIADRVALAEQRCQIARDKNAVEIRILKEKSENLLSERALLNSYITLVAAPENVSNAVLAQRALGLQISVNNIDMQLIEITGLIGESERNQQAFIALEIEQILSERLDSEQKLSEIEAFLAEPRILAREDGKINRTRPVSERKALAFDVEIIEIIPIDQAFFVAEFNLPADAATDIPIGTELDFQVLGTIWSRIPYHGVVDSYGPAGNNQILLRIELTPDSVLRLAEPANGIAIYGAETTSFIEIKQQDYAAFAALRDSFLALFPINSSATNSK